MLASQNGHTETCVSLLGCDKYTAVNDVNKVSTGITIVVYCGWDAWRNDGYRFHADRVVWNVFTSNDDVVAVL